MVVEVIVGLQLHGGWWKLKCSCMGADDDGCGGRGDGGLGDGVTAAW